MLTTEFKYVNADKLYALEQFPEEERAKYRRLTAEQKEIRQYAVNNLEAFIRLVAPYQLLAHCHIDLCKWVKDKYGVNKLVLWPRDHGKSRFAAFYAAWEIVRDPSITIIYASATAEKAEEQLRFIGDILDSKVVHKYFPGLFHLEKGKRSAWNKTFMIVDHPYRKREGVVDSTIMTCGLEKTITGKHCHRLILDDIVVPENNTEQGRRDVNSWAAQAASIMSADSSIFAVGTRYHPEDAYQMFIDMKAQNVVEDENGEEVVEPEEMFAVNIANVEDDGDFLWPRQQRQDGKWFGFNQTILARKRAVYESAGEITQFYAQYYNDPNDKTTSPIARELFLYYDKGDLEEWNGQWSIEGRPLSVYAAVDLAASIGPSSDYSVIVVGGIDTIGNRYVLDAWRERVNRSSIIQSRLKFFYNKFRFKKLRIESVSGFRLVAEDLADSLNSEGIRIPIDFYIPPNNEAKAVRINNLLEPLYQTGSIYHFRGGNCQLLEDELVSISPPHDDLKDAWAMCADLMQQPVVRRHSKHQNNLTFHPRFGGVAL